MVCVSRRRTVTGRRWIPFSGTQLSRAGRVRWVWSSRGLLMPVPWAPGYQVAPRGVAVEHVDVDLCLPLSKIAPQLARIVRKENTACRTR